MIILKQVSQKNKKKVDSFNIKEWEKHNKENNYLYKEKKFWFAAYYGKEILGHVYGNTNGGVAYLDDLIVSKKYRNKGIGKILLRKFEEIAKKRKCHVCLLSTTDNHSAAIKFYKKNGYSTEATLKDMYWHVNEYYMVKRLK